MNELSTPTTPSFEHLYEAYYWPIYRRVYRMLGQREATEDVTQDTFCKAFRAYATIRADSNLYAWLCRIAKNATIDYLHRRDHAVCTSLDALTWDLGDGGAHDPQTGYDGKLEQVAVVLAQLPAHYRELLRLRCAGYTETEIAERFGRHPRTIRGWLVHARACFAREAEVSV